MCLFYLFLYRQQLYERNAFLEPPNQLELDSGGSNFKVIFFSFALLNVLQAN